jgi:hypothetical protein
MIWRKAGVGAGFFVAFLGCAAVLVTMTAAAAEPNLIVVLESWHNLEYAQEACSRAASRADMENITRVLNNASDYDLEYVKRYQEQFDGIWECKSVKDARELGRRLENSIIDQLAVNARCAGVSAYIEGDDKFDGKRNAAAMQAEERNDYWGLHVDYWPGSKVRGWWLFPKKARGTMENGRMISGEGTLSQIAEQVCIVVSGRGASVR